MRLKSSKLLLLKSPTPWTPFTSRPHFSLLQIAPCLKPPLTNRLSCLFAPLKIFAHETSPIKRYDSKRKVQSSVSFITHNRRYKLDALCISSPLQATSAPSNHLSIEEHLEALLNSHSKHTSNSNCQFLMPSPPNP